MANERQKHLEINETPQLDGGTMIIGFDGWMDGADVSTGTVEYLARELRAREIGRIREGNFYILNVPGSMEITALFRPPVKIDEGLIQSLGMPENRFYVAEEQKLLLFRGKEPHTGWEEFADYLLDVAGRCGVKDFYFLGSVGSVLPHTREPVFWGSMTSEALRNRLQEHGISPTNYEGPGHFVTYLSPRVREAGLNMATVVAGIPSYIEGRNPRCIEAMLAKLNALLKLNIDLAPIQTEVQQFLQGVTVAMQKNPKMRERLDELEKLYDEELNGEEHEATEEDAEMRDWFERQNLRLDL